MNHKLDKDTPQFDAQLIFDEIGFVIDKDQYRDALSLVDMYHFHARHLQVCLRDANYLLFINLFA